MREFNIEDGFLVSEILDKTGIEADLNLLFDEAIKMSKDKAAFLGGQIVLKLIKKIHLAKNEIFELISGMTGDHVEVVKKYSLKKTGEVLTEIFSQSGVADFFKQAGALKEKI